MLRELKTTLAKQLRISSSKHFLFFPRNSVVELVKVRTAEKIRPSPDGAPEEQRQLYVVSHSQFIDV
jgi:hypothetical protein